MRDGKVHLPGTISKGSILQELTYFGFEKVHEPSIEQADATAMAAQFILQHALSAKREIVDLDKKKRMMELAQLIFCRIQAVFWKGGCEPNKIFSFAPGNDPEVQKLSPIDDASLNEHLATYGLRSKSDNYQRQFTVDLFCVKNDDTVQK
jgi:hypothetical protein